MSRLSTLLHSCGRGPVVAVAIASAAAFGLGIAASTLVGGSDATIHTVQEGNNGGGQEGQDWANMDPEAMMEMMAQLGAPDEHHKGLMVYAGSWKTEFKAASPEMAAFNSTGEATFEPTMGGRFIKQTYTGDMMGQRFTGIGISGYNKAAKRYESFWHDDMGTPMFFLTGQKTDTGWVYEGEETDPMSGQTYKLRHVIEMDGNDKFAFIMQYPPEVAAQMGVQVEEGQEWVDSFRIEYTRKVAGLGGNQGRGNNGR